jgi:ParB/RepB/Spo0J family partition protein
MTTRYMLVDGGRRWRAAKATGIKKLKAIVLKVRPSVIELLKIRAGLEFHHRPLTWGERIDLACRLQDATGCTINDVASTLQISQPLATKLCKVRNVAPEVRKALDAEVIDIEKAYIISGEPDLAKQVELLKHADGTTREQLRQKARSGGQPLDIKAAVARFPLPKGVMVTVQGAKMNLAGAIDAMVETMKELRKFQSQQFDITTAMRAMRDKAKATN